MSYKVHAPVTLKGRQSFKLKDFVNRYSVYTVYVRVCTLCVCVLCVCVRVCACVCVYMYLCVCNGSRASNLRIKYNC